MSNGKRGKDDSSSEEENPFTKYSASVQSMAETGGEIGHEQKGHARHRVRIISRRVRLCDPDNLVGGVKHLVDALRLACVIPEDDPQNLALEVAQEKVGSFSKEETWVEVTVL